MNTMQSHSEHEAHTEYSSQGEQHMTFKLEKFHCTGCADNVERTLRAQPHITSVQLDWANNKVDVDYHAGMISPQQIEQLVATTGCDCTLDGSGGADDTHAGQSRHSRRDSTSAARDMRHLAHAVDVQPITMGTKFDRMQYEMPATVAHKRHQAKAASNAQVGVDPPVDHAAHAAGGAAVQTSHEDHAAMEHGSAPVQAKSSDHSGHSISQGAGASSGAMDHSAMGHGGMDHDMSDPSMAGAMERDMRNKFFIALRAPCNL